MKSYSGLLSFLEFAIRSEDTADMCEDGPDRPSVKSSNGVPSVQPFNNG